MDAQWRPSDIKTQDKFNTEINPTTSNSDLVDGCVNYDCRGRPADRWWKLGYWRTKKDEEAEGDRRTVESVAVRFDVG